MHAFVLGAGLGTRLRPLTDHCPKPLLELRPGKALVELAFDHLLAQTDTRHLFVNTHWQPQCWPARYPQQRYRETPLTFLHEPTLLDTGGGLANLWPHWRALSTKHEGDPSAPLWLYNGDILCDAPLAPLVAAHAAQDNLVTLMLRPTPGNVSFDPARGRVTDLRATLDPANTRQLPRLQYAGIALIDPLFAPFLQPPGRIFSLVESWLELIQREDRLGAVVIEAGDWADLGTHEEWNAAVTAQSNKKSDQPKN